MEAPPYLQRLSLVLLALSSTACGHAANLAWEDAQRQSTITSYTRFIAEHPTDSRVGMARNRVRELREPADWVHTRQLNNRAAYELYNRAHADGPHVAEARLKIEKIARQTDWETARATDTAPAMQHYIDEYPDSPQAQIARDRLASFNAQPSAHESGKVVANGQSAKIHLQF